VYGNLSQVKASAAPADLTGSVDTKNSWVTVFTKYTSLKFSKYLEPVRGSLGDLVEKDATFKNEGLH
jgi:hypothetical protein